MHVLMLSTSSFDRSYSSYHLMEDIILSLLAAGHKVTLVQYAFIDDSKPPESLSRWSSFSCHAVRMDYEKTDGFANRYIKELRYFYKARKIISSVQAADNIDVAFVQSNNAVWAAVFAVRSACNAKIVYNEQDLFPDNALYSGLIPGGFVFSVMTMLLKWGYKRCSRIITIAPDMKNAILSYLGSSDVPVDVVYNWHQSISPSYEKEVNPLLCRLSESERRAFRVVYAGTIGKMQAVDVLVNAACLLKDQKDIQFFIIGSGSSKESIERMVSERDASNIQVWERVQADLAPYLYSLTSVNYIPLIKNGIKTCLPSKTAICFASSRPLIVQVDSESSFANEVSSYEGVFVVEPGDAAGLAETIEKVRNLYGIEGSPIQSSWPQGSGMDYCRIIEQLGAK